MEKGADTGIHYLNLEYILLRAYEFFTGAQLSQGDLPAQIVAFIAQLAWVGTGLALLFLVGIVYVRLRLHQVEHAGWHSREEASHKLLASEEQQAKSPRWEQIVALSISSEEANWRLAILEADIMLSQLLAERGFTGETLADQLKSANPLQFTTLDLAWEAHRMRNAIAHLGEAFPLTERDVRSTIEQYRRVFEEFGAI